MPIYEGIAVGRCYLGRYLGDGNMGCQVSKGGILNQK